MNSPTTREPLEIRLAGDFAELALWWRELESGAMASPYQGYALTRAWWRHCETPNPGRLRIVGVFHDGAPLAVMPLVVARRFGMKVALPVGARHFNWQFPLWDPTRAALLDADTLDGLMRRVGGVIGADTIVYPNMPQRWAGRDIPFLAGDAEASPSASYHLDLHPDFPSLARERRSGRALKQLRRKRALLADAAGPVSLHRAVDAEDCRRILRIAAAQRAARKKACGIPNFFERPGAEGFMLELLEESCGQSMREAPMSAYYLRAGDTVAATYFGAGLNGNFSCFLNSFDCRFESFSPGDIALHDLIERACAEGLTGFDLGVGDERYKQAWCERIPLYESCAAITLRGRIYGQALRVSRGGKRAIKQNQALWGGWRAVRRVTARTFA